MITIGYMLINELNMLKGFMYLLSQLLGGVFGSILARLIIPATQLEVANSLNKPLGSPYLPDDIKWYEAFVCEFIACFIVSLIVYSSQDN